MLRVCILDMTQGLERSDAMLKNECRSCQQTALRPVTTPISMSEELIRIMYV